MARILATRTANSLFGVAEAWLKDESGKPREFATMEEAEAEAHKLTLKSGPNVYYQAKGSD
jgi:hypothetical protein